MGKHCDPAFNLAPANAHTIDAAPTSFARALTERIRSACVGRSVSEIARMTGFNRETVRRYLLGQRPDVEFVARLAEVLPVSLEWLVAGRLSPSPTLDLAHPSAAEVA